MASLCMDFAHFMWEILREKGQTYDASSKRPSRSHVKKHGKWDILPMHMTLALDAILQVDRVRLHAAHDKRAMKQIHQGKEPQLSEKYELRREASQLW
jgi:hypothetical protein